MLVVQCRIRKIKCDETKPCCRRCQSTGRKCSYELDGRSRRSAPPRTHSIWHSQPLSDIVTYASREQRAFEYYCQRVGPAIAGSISCTFWTGAVLKACRSEPAIWDAIIAISALYENLDPFIGPPMVTEAVLSARRPREAFLWYLRSVENIRSQLARNKVHPQIALISCILYTCTEMLQGDVAKALRLYGQAVQLIISWQQQSPSLSETTLAAKDMMMPLLQSRALSFEAAQTAILKLIAEAHILRCLGARHYRSGHKVSSTTFDLTVQQHALARQLDEWDYAFAFLRSAEGHPQLYSPDRRAIPVLLSIRSAASIMISTCFAEQETAYDEHIGQFRLIVEHAAAATHAPVERNNAQPGFTFEADVGLPLFFTAVKCRDQILRRTSLELLRQTPKVQSMFKSMSWATLAEMIIRIEEGSVQGMRKRPPLQPTINDITAPENMEEPDSSTRGALPAIGSVPSLAELVEIDNNSLDRSSNKVTVAKRQFIPEGHRVHEFGIFQAYGSVPVAMSQRMQNPVILRFTKNQKDPGTGKVELVERFLPMNF
ncbi:hypothetical protein N7468_005983 [Penicillium chermesinum]|uniref:Zn(2)-C6 fungal-type domain-containing protein n=1 Tax=Penicillium chermesinum TaxID=63820 RepID=A0A9W9P0C8_9EURO|nr:uncharacterized protein N7468_005983 [Penicillium chermesinum]KAJ5233027.1 hypothetical protein N7468_005983 [Penicillium chermesinum]